MSFRDYRYLLLTKEIWGENYYFWFGGDKPQGLKDKQINPELHPMQAAELLFELAKACLLTTFIYNKHGARATVDATMLKETLGNLMQTLQDKLLEQLDQAHIFRWKATDKIRHYEHSHGLQVRDNTICASAAGQDCVGVGQRSIEAANLAEHIDTVLRRSDEILKECALLLVQPLHV